MKFRYSSGVIHIIPDELQPVVNATDEDYDIPIAVLGMLTLGMAMDFAIHFLDVTP